MSITIPTSVPFTTALRDLEPLDLARLAAVAAADKKAERPVILEVGPLLSIVEAFVICSAGNDRQVRTIADEVEERIRAAGGGSPLSVEGLAHAEWVLLDYGGVVVHVFHEEQRAFYDLERLWKDAPRVSVPESFEL